ncbi:hypothetical protein DL765_007814 [Monosporascus sp. GIB2]|nr:hypothetical protein DL765_007814 [Monosporascus sp. GIB2]
MGAAAEMAAIFAITLWDNDQARIDDYPRSTSARKSPHSLLRLQWVLFHRSEVLPEILEYIGDSSNTNLPASLTAVRGGDKNNVVDKDELLRLQLIR